MRHTLLRKAAETFTQSGSEGGGSKGKGSSERIQDWLLYTLKISILRQGKGLVGKMEKEEAGRKKTGKRY